VQLPTDRETLLSSVLWNGFQKMVIDQDDEEQNALFAQATRCVERLH
jgi:hypothetical protein